MKLVSILIILAALAALLFAATRKKRDPLDHDGDGRRGGSLRGERSTRAIGARRRRESNPPRCED